jgi:LAS superfamily LD-carboxypeptidase LdcB
MYTIFKSTTESIKAIEQYQLKEQAVARMEYLAINNMDESATGYFVESGDLVRISEWEV